MMFCEYLHRGHGRHGPWRYVPDDSPESLGIRISKTYSSTGEVFRHPKSLSQDAVGYTTTVPKTKLLERGAYLPCNRGLWLLMIIMLMASTERHRIPGLMPSRSILYLV